MRSSCVKFGTPRDQAIYAIVNERWAAALVPACQGASGGKSPCDAYLAMEVS